MDHCLANTKCKAFTFDEINRFQTHNCWLKTNIGTPNMNKNDFVSGHRCSFQPTDPPPLPYGIYPKDSNSESGKLSDTEYET